MKVKKVAVTAAVCAALMGTQAVVAEEQRFAAEGMDFAFDDAKVSSAQMNELSGSEMDETVGSRTHQDLQSFFNYQNLIHACMNAYPGPC